MLESAPYFGSLIGMLIFSYVSDNCGRKLSLSVSWAIVSIGYVGFFFSYSAGALIFWNGVCGLGLFPTLIYDFVYIAEVASPRLRQMSSSILQFFANWFEIVAALMAKNIYNWRDFVLAACIPMVLVNIFSFYMIETPKFWSFRDIKKTTEAFNTINRRNKTGNDDFYED